MRRSDYLGKTLPTIFEISKKFLTAGRSKPRTDGTALGSGQRLPNGNTVIASYGAPGDVGVVKIFELNRDKQIVWQYTGPHRAHEIQVLTTNGEPIPSPALR